MTSIYYEKTPLLKRSFNNGQDGLQFYVKYEALQPGGSFKSRGISHLISKKLLKAREEGTEKVAVFSSSGGNAGLAAAVACRLMELDCTVVVPITTKARMVSKIRNAGAKVIVHGDHWGHADLFLKELMSKESEQGTEVVYVHPFDDEIIWEGHSTIVDEIVEQLQEKGVSLDKLKGIVCSVGGGGLFSGIIKGLEKHKLASEVPVLAVETEGCDALYRSLASGRPVKLENPASVATSLGSPYVVPFAIESALRYGSGSVALSDIEVLRACFKVADDLGLIVEPACGASLHFCYHPDDLANALKIELHEDDVIVVIACGGSCVAYDDLISALDSLSRC